MQHIGSPHTRAEVFQSQISKQAQWDRNRTSEPVILNTAPCRYSTLIHYRMLHVPWRDLVGINLEGSLKASTQKAPFF